MLEKETKRLKTAERETVGEAGVGSKSVTIGKPTFHFYDVG